MNYRLPKNPGFIGRWQWKPVVFSILFAAACEVVATEFLVIRFAQLGLRFGEDPIGYILGVPVYLPFYWAKWAYTYHRWLFHNTPPYTVPLVVAVFIGGFLALILVMNARSYSFNQRARAWSKDMEDLYGSTRWAKRSDLEAAGLLQAPKGLIVGAWREKPDAPLQYLYDSSDRHVLVSAASRTGKTQTLGICNALVWPASMVVVDVKEELYSASAGFRQKQGHICLKFAPLDPESGARLNPLAWIRLGTAKEISDVQKISEGIGNPGNEGSDSSHWNDTSISLLDGVILHEAYKAQIQHGRPATLTDIANSLKPFEQKFEDYLAEMGGFQHDPEGKRGWKTPSGTITKTHPAVYAAAKEALQRDVKEASSVLSTAAKRFRLYTDPLVQIATSGCDIEIEDLVDHEKPVSLYLVVPPSEKRRLAPLLRIILLTILGRLTEKQVPHRHELLWLCDEFPTLGYMAPFEDALAYAGGYGMRFLLIVQNLSQINSLKRYGPDNEIIPNCHVKVFFCIADLKTAELVSKEIGPQTVQHAVVNFGQRGKNSGRVEAQSAHIQNTKRDLVEPAELMRLDLPQKVGRKVVAAGEAVIVVFGHMPIKGIQPFCFFDPKFAAWSKIKPVNQSQALVRRDHVKEAFAC